MIAEGFAGRPVASALSARRHGRAMRWACSMRSASRGPISSAPRWAAGIAQELALGSRPNARSDADGDHVEHRRARPAGRPAPKSRGDLPRARRPANAAEYVRGQRRAPGRGKRGPRYDDPSGDSAGSGARRTRRPARAAVSEGGARQMLASVRIRWSQGARSPRRHTPTPMIHGTSDRLAPLVWRRGCRRAMDSRRPTRRARAAWATVCRRRCGRRLSRR